MELTLETLQTVVGAVAFIELVMELLWKPLIKNISFGGYADIVNNLAAVVLGLIGTVGAGYILGTINGAVLGNLVLVALVAASVSTGVYEVAKNIGVGVRNNLP